MLSTSKATSWRRFEVDTVIQQNGFRRVFAPERLTVGLGFPLEAYEGDVATMENQVHLARRAEELGFAGLWFRDIPLHDPNFDAGQVYDIWVFASYVAAHTSTISLATGGIILPLHHPLHVAKAAASVERLSGGRLLLGVTSGFRPAEYPAFAVDYESRGERFREVLNYARRALQEDFPTIDSTLGRMAGLDLIPKPIMGRIPVVIIGASQQTPEWIAENGDGWISPTRRIEFQERSIQEWRNLIEHRAPGVFKPFGQATYLDLTKDPNTRPTVFFRKQGLRLGRNRLVEYMENLRQIGVNHLSLNLKYSRRPASEVIEELGEEVLSHFPSNR